MNKIFIGLSYFILAAFTLLIFTGCEMNGASPFSSAGTVSPSPFVTDPGRIVVTPTPLSTPFETDDSMLSDIEDLGEGIKDFAEGTVVELSKVPEIVKAVQDKYENVTITGISHAMHMDKQVYKVLFTDDNSTTHTVYVSADGKTITEAVEPEASSSPSASPASSPSVSSSPSASPSATPTEEG